MVETIRELEPITVRIKSGAVASGVDFDADLNNDSRLAHMKPADSVLITSPRTAAGGAGLTVHINGEQRVLIVAGGGASIEEPGPIYAIRVVPDADVAGTAQDCIFLAFNGVNRV